VPKSRWRKNGKANLEDFKPNLYNKEMEETFSSQQTDLNLNIVENFKNYNELSNEEGLSKIKKKLSLKVVIPEDKRKLSWTDGNVI
jgi:hypothetical protein